METRFASAVVLTRLLPLGRSFATGEAFQICEWAGPRGRGRLHDNNVAYTTHLNPIVWKDCTLAFHQDISCPACVSSNVQSLPLPHPATSMLSDGQVIARPLHKLSCENCGYGFHASPPTSVDLRDLFDEDYSLSKCDPDAEVARAEQYAHVIERFLADNAIQPPRHLIELGCGMGSLLSILVQQWGCESAFGVEPSKQLADAAREKNEVATISQGFAEDIAEAHEDRFDLCLSINVIEHTLSPLDFLDVCRKITHPSGQILVVCPDGETPSVELLFYDHISSFTRPALAAFADRAALSIVAAQVLDGPLLGFQMLLLKRAPEPSSVPEAPLNLTQSRVDFLQTWCQSSEYIAAALDGRPYAIFGAGEVTDLLSAYCPDIIDAAQSIVVDNPSQATHAGQPLISTEAFLERSELVLVAAVNLRSWAAVKESFRALGKDIFHPQQRN